MWRILKRIKMRKKTVFATIVAGGIFCAGYLGYADVQGLESVSSLIFLHNKKYNYKIVNIVDGDTVEFEAKFLPDPLKKTLKLRIDGVDTPEKNHLAKCDLEREKAQKAKEFTTEQIQNAREVRIILKKWGKFGGRIVGDISLDGKLLSKLLIDNKHAAIYIDGKGKKKDWCK